jgi:hypothetical protein
MLSRDQFPGRPQKSATSEAQLKLFLRCCAYYEFVVFAYEGLTGTPPLLC